MMKRFGTAVILAGGQSSRMGFDKQNLCVGGTRLTDLIFTQLSEVFSDLVVVTGRPELYQDRAVRLVSDSWADVGPLAGIYSGLKTSQSEYIYVVACDMPLFDPAFAVYLMQHLHQETAAVSRFKEWIEPFHGFYHVSLADKIEHFVMKGNRNIYQFLKYQNVFYCDESVTRGFSSDWKLFDNLNTPEQYRAFLAADTEKETLPMKIACPMLRYENGKWEAYDDEVVQEYTLHLFVNGEPWANLLCSPKALKELVYGFLFSERMIHSPEDITALTIVPDAAEAYARISETSTVKSIRTIATSGAKLYQGQPPVSRIRANAISENAISPSFILDSMRDFTTSSEVFMTTGGVHACSLSSTTSILFFYDDIGRHNALDKIIGRALLEKMDLTDKLIFFSGRISSEIVGKCSNAGISVVVSRAAPTFGAIQAAKIYGMTLIGFTRGNRFNIYEGSHRIQSAPNNL